MNMDLWQGGFPELVIFDLAGTTVEDRGQVPAAFTAALEHHGLRVSEELLNSVRGSTKRQAIFDLLPEGPGRIEKAEAVYAHFCEALQEGYAASGVNAMPGAEKTFQCLKARGVKLALNTGFDRSITSLLLRSLHWADGRFDAVVCGDEVPKGRPAPYMIFLAMMRAGVASVHGVAHLGDTALDLWAGYHAGVRWNYGVISGAHDKETLEQAPHTAILASLVELQVR